jgi:hypothetical protein
MSDSWRNVLSGRGVIVCMSRQLLWQITRRKTTPPMLVEAGRKAREKQRLSPA